MFEVVFDYGDHDLETPLPDEPGSSGLVATIRSHRTVPASKCAPTAYASGS